MTKDVLLTICGYQSVPQDGSGQNKEPVEVITPAVYYYKNGKHYLLYDEIDPDDRQVSHNTLKMSDQYMSVTRHGAYSSQLLIESGKRSVTYYASPFGTLHITLDGKQVEVDEHEEHITASAFYGLEINHEHIADCEIRLIVTPRESGMNLSKI